MIEPKNDAHLQFLYAQIEEICSQFKQIRSEASEIVETSQMPQAALHLNDVLQSSEQAAMTILEAATAIGCVADSAGIPRELQQKISEQVGRIYEASTFQDIGAQRIKKVLVHLSTLETQLQRLSDTAHGQAPAKSDDPLLSGPQLASEAPSQDDIDKLFGSI